MRVEQPGQSRGGAKLTPRELTILRGAAADPEGRHWLNTSDGSAAVRLQDLGLGHWEQSSPFVACFRINDAGRDEAGERIRTALNGNADPEHPLEASRQEASTMTAQPRETARESARAEAAEAARCAREAIDAAWTATVEAQEALKRAGAPQSITKLLDAQRLRLHDTSELYEIGAILHWSRRDG